MSIQESAMLVTLSVSCWTASKKDKKVSAEVEAAHNARDAGRYSKLLIDKAFLDPLTKHCGVIRAHHYRLTLPWLDNGARLLPAKLYMEYTQGLRKLQAEYETLIDTFIHEYDTRLVTDARLRLGTMYDPDDYPPGSDLRSKFGIETDITEVPSGSDFRVDIGDAERRRIAAQISERVERRQVDALTAAWARVRELVDNLRVRLSDPKPIIRDSHTDNLRDLAGLLPGLNITNDPKLETACQAITNTLLISPDALRRSRSTRMLAVKNAESILNMCPS